MTEEEKRRRASTNGGAEGGSGPGIVPARGEERLPSTEFREPVPDFEEEVHLRDYLDVLVRRKWLIVGFLLMVFVSTGIFTLTATRIYKAGGTVEVNPQTPRVTKFEEVTPTDIRNQQLLQTQADLLKSQALARRAAERASLAARLAALSEESEEGALSGVLSTVKAAVHTALGAITGGGPADDPRRPLLSPEEQKERNALEFLTRNLAVSPRRDSMLIDLSFTSPDRQLSRDVVNALTEEFVNWEMDKKMDASKTARAFLMKQIDQARINLEKSEEELNRFAKHSGIVSLDSKLNSVYRQLEELNSALAAAEADLIGKRTLYEQAVEDGPSDVADLLENDVIAALKEEHAKVYADYKRLSVTFHDAYPEVKALKERMESLEERIREEEQRLFRSVKSRFEAAKKKVTSLRQRALEQKDRALELNERATQYKILSRQVETNKAIYQSLLERSKEIESMVGVSASNIHIVDRASLPLLPYKPKVFRNLLLAIVLGLMGGIGLAFFVEYFSDTVTKPEEISERFRIPILGLAPMVKENGLSPEHALTSDPRSPMSEALRTAKVSIQLSRADTHSKSFLISSSQPSEGKTTLAINMAVAFAQSGERVLLMDADLRKPRIHKLLGGKSAAGNGTTGLSNLLAGMGNKNPIRETGIPNLHFIPAGPIPPNPVELLAGRRFRNLIRYLEKHYDRIILDTPPNQGFADVLVVSRQVGGVVLVTCLGETTREALRHFKKSIMNVQGNILGCIINKVDFTRKYGYSSYYRYYGHYYSTEYYGNGKKKGKRRGRGAHKQVREKTGPDAEQGSETPIPIH